MSYVVGSPGLGPLSLRKDMVKFQDDFRSRDYCLGVCTKACAVEVERVKSIGSN